jgi:hypothetical protein
MYRQPIIRCAEEPRLRHPSQARFFLGMSRLEAPQFSHRFRNLPALLHAAHPGLILNAGFPIGIAGGLRPLFLAGDVGRDGQSPA